MSIDCGVYAMEIPDNIESALTQELCTNGFMCELRPDTNILEYMDTGPWFKLSRFPAVHRISPETPLLVGFGLEAVDMREVTDPARIAEIHEEARALKYEFCFRTAAGRIDIHLAMQFVCAAALAKVTRGFFIDCQDDSLIPANMAMEYVLREIRDCLHDEGAIPFIEWPPISFDDELNYEFPAPIQSGRTR